MALGHSRLQAWLGFWYQVLGRERRGCSRAGSSLCCSGPVLPSQGQADLKSCTSACVDTVYTLVRMKAGICTQSKNKKSIQP